MKLYLLSQDDHKGHDTYDSCIVAARNEDEARLIKPDGSEDWTKNSRDWANSPNFVDVELIGTAVRGTKKGLVLASFNAG